MSEADQQADDRITGTLIDALVMTAHQNKFPTSMASIALGFMKLSGGDYTLPLAQDFPEQFREVTEQLAGDLAEALKRARALDDSQIHTTPMVVEKPDVEGFVFGIFRQLGLPDEMVPTVIGIIQFAGGHTDKPVHIPTLGAFIQKAGARYGYEVSFEEPNQQPLNITGGRSM